MDIYLVRVSQQNGKLCLIRKLGTTNDSYVAISHVWGDPQEVETVHVEGVGMVKLSPIKRRGILSILSQRDVCGNEWFWMDLFCIDQSDNGPISIADQLMAIPAIYKSSRCVKVLIESPVCKDWHATASNTEICRETYPTTSETALEASKSFEQWELLHSRKCSGMLFLDPWFERLWTRQEGLYAGRLQMIMLNPVDCTRWSISQSDERKWTVEGHNSLKRDAVYNFIDDKIRYHGLQLTEFTRFQFYLDLVYRGDLLSRSALDIANYGGAVGPVSGYFPIDASWRSGRKTTKLRDYVLAVLPDVDGYQVPVNVRDWSFQRLLCNALKQLESLFQHGPIALKVTNGTARKAVDSSDSFDPFTLNHPNDVTEAFDCLAALEVLKPRRLVWPPVGKSNSTVLQCGSWSFTVAANSTKVETVEFTRENLPSLIQYWTLTANFFSHICICALSGPCLGTSRLQDNESLLHRYLAFQFTGPVINDKVAAAKHRISTPHGVVNLDKLEKRISVEDFELYLKRFMACLVCGVTLRTANAVLANAEFRMIETLEFGHLMALINIDFLSSREFNSPILITRGLHEFEGFHLAIQDEADGSCRIVGRTWIPNGSVDKPLRTRNETLP